MSRVADLVKQKRISLGESQKEFGKRFGISHAAVSDWETGKTRFFPEELISLLFTLDNQPTPNDYLNRGYNEALKDMQLFLIDKHHHDN